ncbi:class I SAM-dependent methyltransferase [Sphingomonas panacisoli]|uniref:Class I SAM-dependent methyltransferase n=1 Tax=Sphingomonas panacisoli TaxID=1813879 RepID=A0A5B8LJ01_9SPHN|nr:class I SAM-dependent methyltransferase [Sphingomonas panacisoli]QDZ07926.1 class I SAM-dependent methyltransferase [Sphingomonas panacisoli]
MSGRIDRGVGRSIFGLDPAGYHAARLDYPDALYERIFDRADFPVRAVVEIGAGTGHATAKLLAPGVERLVAVEPDAALADYLRTTFAGGPVDVVNSDFVAAPIDGRFDLAAAASSFHWLDPDAALGRIHALLRPGGRIALWWNAYRQPGIGDPFADATMPLLDGIDLPPSESMRGHYSLDADLHIGRLREGGFDAIEHHVFRRERMLSAADARALYASYSFVRALPDDRRTALLDAIGDLVDREFGGSAPNVVLTALYLGRRTA